MTLEPLLWLHCSIGQMPLGIHHRNPVKPQTLHPKPETRNPKQGVAKMVTKKQNTDNRKVNHSSPREGLFRMSEVPP